MEWLFGKKKTPEEMLRENQRALRKAMRSDLLLLLLVLCCLRLFFFSSCFLYAEAHHTLAHQSIQKIKSNRELERERGALEKQEQKIINDLRKTAKAGQLVRWPSNTHEGEREWEYTHRLRE